MGYGSTHQFLHEAAFMEAASIGSGARMCALGNQVVRIGGVEQIKPIRSFIEKFGGEFDEQAYRLRVGSPFHVRRVYEDCGISYISIDMNKLDGSVAIDLNEPPIRHELGNTFDILTNYGTTEHVANQINAFAWSHYFLRSGGLMFLRLPLFQFANHAMNLVTPYFFKKLINGNRYEILEAKIHAVPTDNGIAFHYGEELAFIEGLTNLIENSPFAAQVWMVLKKTSKAAFVPPLDINLPDDQLRPIIEDYIRR